MKSTKEIGINIFRDKEKIAIMNDFDLVRIFIKSLVKHESYSVESMVRGEEKKINGSIFMYDFNTDETLFVK